MHTDSTNPTTNTLQFRIPINFGRDGLSTPTTSPETAAPKTTPLQKALIRGHQWLRMLETGEAKNLKEVAQQAGLDPRYVNRMLNLTRLAPYIVADILDDKLPKHATIAKLAINTPRLWQKQRTLTQHR